MIKCSGLLIQRQNTLKSTDFPDLGCRFVSARKTTGLSVIALFCSALLFGCAQVSKTTYPENFVYLNKQQVSSKMALMSFYMQQIDEILLDDSAISSRQQAQIIGILTRIDANADSLVNANYETRHLVIDNHIDQFKTAVNLALNNVRAEPPNYYALGKLSGSCAACHQHR